MTVQPVLTQCSLLYQLLFVQLLSTLIQTILIAANGLERHLHNVCHIMFANKPAQPDTAL